MNGIEIIEETTNIITETHNAWAAAGVAFLIAIAFLIVAVAIVYYQVSDPGVGCVVIVWVVTVVGAIVGCSVAQTYVIKEVPIGTETIYEVSISDDVRFNEFVQKYEIIEWKDFTVVVKERPELPERPLYTNVTTGSLDGCFEDATTY